MRYLLCLCMSRMSNKTLAFVSMLWCGAQSWEKRPHFKMNLILFPLHQSLTFHSLHHTAPTTFTTMVIVIGTMVLFTNISLCFVFWGPGSKRWLWMTEKDGIIEKDVSLVWCPYCKILKSQWPNPLLTFLLQVWRGPRCQHYWLSKGSPPNSKEVVHGIEMSSAQELKRLTLVLNINRWAT